MAKPGPFPNVPPPGGSRPASAYTRFIPREELGEFSAWNPNALAGAAGSAGVAPERRATPRTDSEQAANVASARQSGYQDGYRDGLVALEGFKQSFAGQMSGQIGKLIESIDSQFEDLEAQMAQAVAQSALSLARQIVRSELQTHPEVVAKVATEAVQAMLLSARHITVLAHPLDVPLIEQGAAEVLATREARVVASDTIERGGCRIESDLGAVDARIAARWTQAAASFAGDTPWVGADDDVQPAEDADAP